MALTVSIVKRDKNLNQRLTYADVTFDSSYATGGESLTPAQLGLTVIDFFEVDSNPGYLFKYDYTNQKLKAYFTTAAVTGTLAATVASGATPVTSGSANGTGIVTLAGNPAIAAAAGAEVTASTNLSTLTIRVKVTGI